MTGSSRCLLAIGVAATLAVTACGAGDRDITGRNAQTSTGSVSTPHLEPMTRLGAAEGHLAVLAWPGYAEDGSTDEAADWVTPFEKATGCQVDVETASTSDQMLDLMATGRYDVVSASGDVSLELIASGEVEPLNTDLVPNYMDVFAGLKRQQWNSVRGVEYGVPHGRAANVLMYRTDQVTPAPHSWSLVFDPESPYQGKITAYDSPLYIADAALYLMKTKPDLGITNPYALDEDQLGAAVDLLKQQNANIGDYWDDYLKELDAFKSGAVVVGTSWQSVVNLAQADRSPISAVLPQEGATGFSDTWMVASKSKHQTCAYKWLNHIISPAANAAASDWLGQAPANAKSCALTIDKHHCTIYHAADEAYFDKVWPWTRPVPRCLDGRRDVECTDYAEWESAWQDVMG
jgi:putative spermidine/putrescine transport system substrate-binding protein